MSRIVDIRHGRIAAACAHPAGCEGELADMPALGAGQGGAEIILFPMLHRSFAGRPRKRVTRRFRLRLIRAAE